MNFKDALTKVDDLLPALEKLLAPDAMLAFRTVYDAAHGCAIADVMRGVNQATAKALEVTTKPFAEHADAVTTPHLYVGRAGGTCYLCPHPRGHGHPPEPRDAP